MKPIKLFSLFGEMLAVPIHSFSLVKANTLCSLTALYVHGSHACD